MVPPADELGVTNAKRKIDIEEYVCPEVIEVITKILLLVPDISQGIL